jgi:hypothetical protein
MGLATRPQVSTKIIEEGVTANKTFPVDIPYYASAATIYIKTDTGVADVEVSALINAAETTTCLLKKTTVSGTNGTYINIGAGTDVPVVLANTKINVKLTISTAGSFSLYIVWG